jgi:hypothetical protein
VSSVRGIRRACGEVPGCNRWGNPRMNRSANGGKGRARVYAAKAFSFAHHNKVVADGTVRKNSV